MFPSECLLQRRVLSDGHRNGAATNLPLFILKCEDRRADGYADDLLDLYNQRLQGMVIGVRLADKPPAVSYLVILGAPVIADIVALDKSAIVFMLGFIGEAHLMSSYLIYDAVALSLRLIPMPKNIYSGSSLSIARPCRHGGDYALVHTGILTRVSKVDDDDTFLFLWRPSSPPSSLPWSEKKKSSFPDVSVYTARTEFSFSVNGHAYWVNLERGISYCSCDALLDDATSVVESGGFIHLPLELVGYHRNSHQVMQPGAWRTMGVVCDSFIRLVSIDGFKNKKTSVTVWRLLGHDEGWEKEHEFSMETLWGFEGLANVPNNLEPMYPLLSTKDADVVYLALGEYHKHNEHFSASAGDYRLAVDMRKKMVTSVSRAVTFPNHVVSWAFSCKALLGPCDDGGVPIPTKNKKKRKPRRDGKKM